MIAYLRVDEGVLPSRSKVRFMASAIDSEAEEAGVFAPEATPVPKLEAGEVGYLVTGLKDVHQAKVGDTVTLAGKQGAREPLPGYREPKPMVWSGLFPAEGGDYSELREALDRLKLNDAALVYEPETSRALGFGFRCGFLGLLHMDIVKERLEREFGLELIATAPNVEFDVIRGDETIVVHNPSEMPQPGTYDHVEEPVVRATVITPSEYLGPVLELCQARRGELARHAVPVARARRGPLHAPARRDHLRLLRPAEVQDPRVRLARLRADRGTSRPTWSGSTSSCTASPSTRSRASSTGRRRTPYGRQMVERLRELIPRQLFDVAIQASIGSRIVARETVKAKRKDVLAKCYGGDITRKRKLLETAEERARSGCGGSAASTCRRRRSSRRCASDQKAEAKK